MSKRHIWRTVAVTLIVILLVALALLIVMKPRQEQITPALLETKEENTSAYLDFIANNFVGGGVPKDGIPAVDTPQHVTPEEAELQDGLRDDDLVFGVSYGGSVIAYPRAIMYWHEIANEQTKEGDISVTYCPLTGSVIGYKDVSLGVSGKLYNSNLVMYDRKTDSEIPQILGKSVNGPDKGGSLETFPVEVTTWLQWKTTHPDTQVLSRNTGYSRAYDDPPYQGYDAALRVWFPVAAESSEFHTKKIVHGIEHDGATFAVVKENVKEPITITTENDELFVTRDADLDTIHVASTSGKSVKHFDVFWFAWYAYHPDTVVV